MLPQHVPAWLAPNLSKLLFEHIYEASIVNDAKKLYIFFLPGPQKGNAQFNTFAQFSVTVFV